MSECEDKSRHSTECGCSHNDIQDLQKELAEKDAEIHRLRLGNLSSFDFERLMEWMKNPDRKPAAGAFTAGAARDAARAFEYSDITAKLAEKDARIKELEEDSEIEGEAIDQANKRSLEQDAVIEGLRGRLERADETHVKDLTMYHDIVSALEAQISAHRGALEKIVKALTRPDSEFERVANESKEGQLVVIAFHAMRSIAEEALQSYPASIPESKEIIEQAVKALEPIAEITPEYLRSGYWLDNGDITEMSKKAREALSRLRSLVK